MTVQTLKLANEAETIALAEAIAPYLTSPLMVTFKGEIGAGKTTLIRAILKTMGVVGAIKSPTFSLVETYTLDKFKVHHYDLYRISDAEELEYIGFRDYFSENDIFFIEWPERAFQYLKDVDVAIELNIKGSGRQITLKGISQRGRDVMTQIK